MTGLALPERSGAATDGKRLPLQAVSLSKSFGPVTVLHDLCLDVRAGEVHAIIGENGAGKSTLMKVFAGHLRPSSGQIRMDGEAVTLASPVVAEALGVVLVHQEILLAPDLTVAQNLFLGREIRRGWTMDDRAMRARAREALASLGSAVEPDALVGRLSIAQRQLVQIARVLLVPHRVVIFDEPTASLTPFETDALLRIVADIRSKGAAVLYISHKLPEVKTIADRVTILRDGRLVSTDEARGLDPLEMARRMVGRDVAKLYPDRAHDAQGEAVLDVQGFSVPRHASNANFQLKRGEILGFAGLVGAGRTELMEGIVGLRPGRGSIRLDGRSVTFGTVGESQDAGIVYLSEDRKGKGLLLDRNLKVNLTLASLPRFKRGLGIHHAAETIALDKAFRDFEIRAGSRDALAGQLSGGNQQKLLLAKMMLLDPRVVIIDEPTRGIDIGAKEQIYAFIGELAGQGRSIIVVSSEMPELIGICDRILVMRAGEIVGEVTSERMTETEIVVLATGADAQTAVKMTTLGDVE